MRHWSKAPIKNPIFNLVKKSFISMINKWNSLYKKFLIMIWILSLFLSLKNSFNIVEKSWIFNWFISSKNTFFNLARFASDNFLNNLFKYRPLTCSSFSWQVFKLFNFSLTFSNMSWTWLFLKKKFIFLLFLEK